MESLIQEWRDLNEAMNYIAPGSSAEASTIARLDEIETTLGTETVNRLMDETY